MMEITRICLTTIDSTNNWAKSNLSLCPLDQILLITTYEQTAGRGRWNRSWISPAGEGVHATFVFAQRDLQYPSGHLSLLLALAAVDVLEKLSFSIKLKWPNDLILAGKKLGGILGEVITTNQGNFIILGIGINVNLQSDTLKKIDQPATSLFVEGGKFVEVEDVLEGLSETFKQYLAVFWKKGFDPFVPLYQKHLKHHKGDSIRFHLGDFICEGIFESIGEDGALKLKLPSGAVRSFIAGEID